MLHGSDNDETQEKREHSVNVVSATVFFSFTFIRHGQNGKVVL